MIQASTPSRRFLVLGPSTGWHADQLAAAASRRGDTISFGAYETLSAGVMSNDCPDGVQLNLTIEREGNSMGEAAGEVTDFDAILVRTMPAASLERITFRLAYLHAISDGVLGKQIPVINPPRGLEIAIDKFATLARLRAAGLPTPQTRLVQTRREALDAFDDLGGDCIVKPMLGGEGKGVMRICDRQLAWYSFSTLDQLDAVLQIQAFVPPGGRDERYLVIGTNVFAVRRENSEAMRSNVSAGAVCRKIDVDAETAQTALRITDGLGLKIASVDRIDNERGPAMYLEVNAIPGWKGAQCVVDENIADAVLETLHSQVENERQNQIAEA